MTNNAPFRRRWPSHDELSPPNATNLKIKINKFEIICRIWKKKQESKSIFHRDIFIPKLFYFFFYIRTKASSMMFTLSACRPFESFISWSRQWLSSVLKLSWLWKVAQYGALVTQWTATVDTIISMSKCLSLVDFYWNFYICAIKRECASIYTVWAVSKFRILLYSARLPHQSSTNCRCWFGRVSPMT